MVHAASLILDDLPAMDNAELRRGVPANHRVFGEATAILAAIGLLNRSYGVVSECRHLDDSQRTEGVNILHRAIGVQGLVGGQQQDLHDCRTYTDIGDLEAMFGRKTGALFAAAAELGVLAAERSDLGNHLASFGFEVGIAFQILDDVLDAQARRDKAGKDVQQDRDRPNYSIMLGPAEAKQRALAKIRGAVSTVSMLAARNGGSGQLLSMFVEHMSRAFDDILSEPGSLIRAASG